MYADLKHLTREKEQIQGRIAEVKNNMEAENRTASPNPQTLSRLNKTLEFLNEQQQDAITEIKQAIDSDTALKEKIEKVCTILGIG